MGSKEGGNKEASTGNATQDPSFGLPWALGRERLHQSMAFNPPLAGCSPPTCICFGGRWEEQGHRLPCWGGWEGMCPLCRHHAARETLPGGNGLDAA